MIAWFFKLQPAFARLLLVTLLALSGCASAPTADPALQRFVFEQPQMGVPFRLIFYADDEAKAREAARKAFERIAQLNQIMSDYETDSELNQLSYTSGSGQVVPLSSDLWNVLSFAQQIARQSKGAFDVTIGPCASLWRKARREAELPEPWRIQHFLQRVGYTNLVLHPKNRAATLLKENMRLDLGGIAKGYAADAALEVLHQSGFPRALVAASGDLAIGDPPPGQTGWKIEVIGSDLPGAPPSFTTSLRNAGIATSGDLSQRLEINGIRYSHILDPFTCVGMTNHALTTVVAPNCTTADPLATTLSILEIPEAKRLAASRKIAFRTIRLQDEQFESYENPAFQRLKRHSSSEVERVPDRLQ